MRKVLNIAAAVALTTSVAAMQPAEPEAPREQLICKSETKTGSRFARRTCQSKAERQMIADEHKRSASEMIDRPILNKECGRLGEPC